MLNTKTFPRTLILLLLLGIPFMGQGQGNSCNTATTLTINGSCDSGTISDSNEEAPFVASSSCTGNFRDAEWYTFTVTGGSLNVTITANTSNRNLFLMLVSGSCASPTEISCSNNDNSNNSAQTETINAVLADGTYYIKVVNVATNGGGMTLTSICVKTPPVNNDCPGTILTVNSGNSCTVSSNGTTSGATQSSPAILCNGLSGNADDDVWYQFTATGTNHDITVTPNTLNDAVVELLSAPCNGTTLACADATTGSGQEVINAGGLTAGLTYYVRVYSYGGSGNEGSFNICVTTPAPSNDNCPGTTISVNADTSCTISTNSDTTGMTQSIAPILCNGYTGNSDDDVWFNFVATAVNHDITVTPTSLNDAVVELLSAPCNGTSLACADATTGSSAEVINASGLTIGNTYYVRVYSWGGGGNEGTFNICVNTPGPYCQPTTSTPSTVYVDTVSFLGTLQDVTNASTGYSGGFQDHTGLATISKQVEGEGVNVYVEANQSCRFKAWVDWNGDGYYDDATEEVYDSDAVITLSTTFGFIIPLTTPSGDYRMRIRNYKRWQSPPGNYTWSYDYNACENFTSGSGYTDYGEAEDYLFTVEPYCDALISTITDGQTCGPGTVDLSVTGTEPTTGFRWYDSETGGSLLFDDSSGTGNWTTPSISATTSYWVTAYNGTCESSLREQVIAEFNTAPALSVTPTASSERIVCGENSVLQLTATGDIDAVVLIDEDFESGDLGVFENNRLVNNGPSINPLTAWQNESSTFIPAEQVWFPAISSGFGPNQFAMSNSDVGAYTIENALETSNSYNTNGFSNLTLEMRMYYSHYLPDGQGGADDYVAIEVSTNGSSWTAVTSNIIADVGIGTRFDDLSYDLSAYVDEPTLWVRVRFYAIWSDGVAVDDITLFGNKDITAVDWSTSPAGSVDLYLDAGGVTPYTGGPETTVYAIPSLSQLENTSFDFIADANLANGCGAVSENFTVTNKTRIWNGTSSSWDNSENWSPNGIPDATTCVIIRDNGGSNPNPVIGSPMPPSPSYAYNLSIESGGFLEIGTQRWLTVTDAINVDSGGLLYLRDSGSLIQINDVNNTGDIYMERSPKFNGNPVDDQEFVYWSSPVESFDVGQISPGATPGMLWEWIPSVSGNGSGNHGYWTAATGNMTEGKGYIVSGLTGTPSNYPISGFPSVILPANTALFAGVARNGNVNMSIYHGGWNTGSGSYTSPSGNTATELDDNWNLVGNPYPSAISADDFILTNAANIADDDTPAIIGTVWLWPHTSGNSATNADPFYENFGYNYNDSDYIEYNYLGANPPGFNGYIAAGQGFFVLADDSADTGGADTVAFTNSMRNDAYSNDNFLSVDPGLNSISVNGVETEKHRIWLDLVSPNNVANTILVGYATGATNELDKLYDAYEFAGSQVSFYSLLEDNKLSIQGRSLPFNDEDNVPLGLKVVQNGSYYIGINALDGLFENENQAIYLEDTYLGYIHDLKDSPYSFSSSGGNFEDRFVLRFMNETLGLEDADSEDTVSVTAFESQIKLISLTDPLTDISVYDLLGRTILDFKPGNEQEFNINASNWSKAPYLVRIKTNSGKEYLKKILLQ